MKDFLDSALAKASKITVKVADKETEKKLLDYCQQNKVSAVEADHSKREQPIYHLTKENL